MINGSLLKNLVRLHKTLEITTSFRFDWKHRGFKLLYNIASKFVKSNSIVQHDVSKQIPQEKKIFHRGWKCYKNNWFLRQHASYLDERTLTYESIVN